jgi:hypothetical protein
MSRRCSAWRCKGAPSFALSRPVSFESRNRDNRLYGTKGQAQPLALLHADRSVNERAYDAFQLSTGRDRSTAKCTGAGSVDSLSCRCSPIRRTTILRRTSVRLRAARIVRRCSSRDVDLGDLYARWSRVPSCRRQPQPSLWRMRSGFKPRCLIAFEAHSAAGTHNCAMNHFSTSQIRSRANVDKCRYVGSTINAT